MIKREIKYRNKTYPSISAFCKEKQIDYKDFYNFIIQKRNKDKEFSQLYKEYKERDIKEVGKPNNSLKMEYNNVVYESATEFCRINNVSISEAAGYQRSMARKGTPCNFSEAAIYVYENPKTVEKFKDGAKEFDTLKEACEKHSFTPSAVCKTAKRKGISASEAYAYMLIREKKKMLKNKNTDLVCHGKEYSSIVQFCEERGLIYPTFIKYYNANKDKHTFEEIYDMYANEYIRNSMGSRSYDMMLADGTIITVEQKREPNIKALAKYAGFVYPTFINFYRENKDKMTTDEIMEAYKEKYGPTGKGFTKDNKDEQ